MSAKNDGGPAFPCLKRDGYGNVYEDGMSLRHWLAGQALNGLLANGGLRTETEQLDDIPAEIANMAAEAADALLAELAKGDQK